MRSLIIASILFLAACTGVNGVQRLTIACNGYAATLNALSAYKMAGKLSEEQIATVDTWEPVLTDACTGDPENVTGDLLDTVEMAMFELIRIQEEAK